tara:strand:- start:1267 stop:2412 length:1146 start_codon:yes stop_codon:yes gene_type:complete
MKKLKTLHIASFEGNIGDNANHNGTIKLLKQNLTDFDLQFTELEIREFFWKKRFFDDDFVHLANQFDLIIFGGGNFFELWVQDSCNSTSVDIKIEILEKINSKIIFYSLGLDPAQGIANIDAFKSWVNYIISKPEKYKLSVRNDGALDTVKEYLGEKYLEHFNWVPDGGFFVETSDFYHPEIDSNKKTIGVNIAGDMLDVRFPNKTGHITSDQFIVSLAKLMDEVLEEREDINFVFFPHIYKDLDFISILFKKVNDWNVRRRITVAPYLHGTGAEKYIFDLYKKCELIMGNRFHTNVCAIGMGIPTIGLINYRQIGMLYKELNLEDRCVEVNKKGFKNLLKSNIYFTLDNKNELCNAYIDIKEGLLASKTEFHTSINKWLS